MIETITIEHVEAEGAVKATRISVPIESILVRDRLRNLKQSSVKSLADSMQELGLQHPISIRFARKSLDGLPQFDIPELVAGSHRLEAARILGWEYIYCIAVEGDGVRAQLWQISENLHRVGLSIAERNAHIRRYAEILEGRVSQTRQNILFESKRADGRGHRKKGLSSSIAQETGLSKKSIDRALKGDDSAAEPSHPAASKQQANPTRDRLTKAWNKASAEDRTWFIDWATQQ